MDLDVLANEFRAFKARVEPLLTEYEAHRARSGEPARASSMVARDIVHASAQEHLDAGRLDEAGKAVGLDRAHGGDEDDESFGRRLLAHLRGAKHADAEVPRPAPEEAPEAEGEAQEDAGGAQDPANPDAAPPPQQQPQGAQQQDPTG